ncbi:MAG TPA: methyltransferase domain-containing protein [Candidatus Paceibacterota bacterium]|nr:methyltransferase domain-containing protein [Candidatus Paceibacterota bacterium]
MFTKPETNILHLGLREGMRVADFGAGTGFYCKAISPRVGNSGKVYAIEVQKDLVKKLESDLKELGIHNVDCIWGDIERRGGTKLLDNSMDVVIISNVLFQVEDKIGIIDEAKRVLRKGGKILLVDWSDSFGGMGPAPHHVMPEAEARELFEKRGFRFEEKISTSVHHYGIIFTYE